MRAGQVWSEGQTIGERAIELSRAEAAVDDAEAEAGAVTGAALVSDAVVSEGLMSERDASLEESLRLGPPAASETGVRGQGSGVRGQGLAVGGGQGDSSSQTSNPYHLTPNPYPPIPVLEPAPLLGWLSDMALSSAALGSLVVWHWRRAERNSPPLAARRWGLDLKRPLALEIEKLPQQ
jgi:hypothetical protein